jgi:hypothetical protein
MEQVQTGLHGAAGENQKRLSTEDLNAGLNPTGEGGSEQGFSLEGALKVLDDFVRGAADIASLGFADEIAAGGNTLLQGQSPVTGLSLEASPAFEQNLARERAKDDNADPVARTAGQVAGGVGAAFATPVPKLLAGGASVLGNMFKGAALGSGSGAAIGFGSAEGGLENRLQGAGEGALLGAGFGAAAPAAVGLGEKALKAIRNAATRTSDRAKQRALAKLAQALRRDEVTPQQAMSRLRTLGDEAIMADLGGENTLGLARAAGGVPGRAKNQANRVLTTRANQQGERIEVAVGELVGGRPFDDVMSDLLTTRAKAARGFYGEALESGKVISNRNLESLLGLKQVKSAIARARSIDPRLQGLPDNHIQVLDAAYKRLSGLSSKAKRSGDGDLSQRLRELRTSLMDAIADPKTGLPVYRKAVSTFADDSTMIDALESGRGFFKQDATITKRALETMTEGEREMYVTGAAQAILDRVQAAPNGRDVVTKIFGSPKLRAQLRSLFPTDQAFRKFQSAMVREARFTDTNRAASPRAGSRTTPMAAEIADAGIGEEAVRLGRDAAVNGTRGLVTSLLDRAAGGLARKLGPAPNPALGDVMFNQGVRNNEALLLELMRRQQQAGRTGRIGQAAGLGGGAAGGSVTRR